jgi:hypothetical protein
MVNMAITSWATAVRVATESWVGAGGGGAKRKGRQALSTKTASVTIAPLLNVIARSVLGDEAIPSK